MKPEKIAIMESIDGMKDELIQLSHNIHDNPELGFKEFKAVEFISKVLENHGFTVEKGYFGLETSFRARKPGKAPGPRIAFLAEYDALPGVDHGCGHNIIATTAVGAFLGLSSIMENYAGEVNIIGCPAEENGAGKTLLVDRGGFDDVDFALMMHPSTGDGNIIARGGRAATDIKVDFHGKTAHSSVPSSGINALSAAINLFNQIDLLRPTFEVQDNINGIILEGGKAPNIIPDLAKCDFSLRAETWHRLDQLTEMVKGCIARAESLTGAKADVVVGPVYAERYPNMPMCEAFKNNMAELGIEMRLPDPKKLYGSSDVGNVSIKIPAIHDYLSISKENLRGHSVEVAAAAASEMGDTICIKGAKGLAMTGFDILESEEFRKVINDYHEKQIPDFYKKK